MESAFLFFSGPMTQNKREYCWVATHVWVLFVPRLFAFRGGGTSCGYVRMDRQAFSPKGQRTPSESPVDNKVHVQKTQPKSSKINLMKYM